MVEAMRSNSDRADARLYSVALGILIQRLPFSQSTYLFIVVDGNFLTIGIYIFPRNLSGKILVMDGAGYGIASHDSLLPLLDVEGSPL